MKDKDILEIKRKATKNESDINSIASALVQTNRDLSMVFQTATGILNILREMPGFDEAMEKAKAIQEAKNKESKDKVKDMEVVDEEVVKSFEMPENE